MIKKYKGTLLLTTVLLLIPMITGLLLWNTLPEQVATHWGPDGQPDGWSSKAFAVFAIPGLILAIHWFCILVTALDPRSGNQSNKAVGMVLWICPVISIFCNAAICITALGLDFDMNRIVFLVMGGIFLIIGNYLPKCKHNYTIGIKLPWTLASEENWNATHRFGGKVWVIGSLVILLCSFIPGEYGVWIMIAGLLVMALIPMVYSYFYYRKHKS